MVTERALVPLSKLAAPKGLIGGPFGSSLVKADYVPAGVPVIRGQNLSGGGRFRLDDLVFVSTDKVQRDLARNTAQPGDVVFTQRGTLGQVGLVPEGPYERYVVSQSQMRFRADPARSDPRYIYYCFRDPRMVRQIQSSAIVTGVPHINLRILSELFVPYCELTDQKGIADVLERLAALGR